MKKMRKLICIAMCFVCVSVMFTHCSECTFEGKIIGKWKIVSCNYFKANDKLAGLSKDYYKLNIGRVIEYKKDMTAQWINKSNSFKYKMNAFDTTIEFGNETIKIIKLTDMELVIKEVRDSASVITNFIKEK